MFPVNIKKLNKILFNAKNTLALSETLSYYLQNKNGLRKGIDQIFSKILPEDSVMDMVKVFKIAVQNEKSLAHFMTRFNPLDVKLLPGKKCSLCQDPIESSGIEQLLGATHIFCWLEELNIDKKRQKIDTHKEIDMIDKKTNNVKKVEVKEIETEIKEATEIKKEEIEKSDEKEPFKEGSKYAFVYKQIIAGKSKEDIISLMSEKYGEKTAGKANMSIYFSTIIKKTGVTIK